MTLVADPELAAPAAADRGRAGAASEAAVAIDAADAIPAFELADARWVEGRVVFPAGTPADERIEIVAEGRLLSKQRFHSAVVAPDGSFRVAFSKETNHAWLALRGRYAYLESRRKVDLDTETKGIVLEPVLGACLRGRLVPARTLVGGEARFVGTRIGLVTVWSKGQEVVGRHGDVDEELEFEVGGIPAGRGLDLTAAPSKAARIRQRIAAIAAGTTRTVELDLLPGVTLRGSVIDETGTGVEGAKLQVLRRSEHGFPRGFDGVAPEQSTSGSDGRFEIEGTAAGDWVVHARMPTFVGASAETGELADGAVRDGLTLLLTRGASIRGRVEFADGKPAGGAHVSWRSLAPPDGEAAVVFGTPSTTQAELDGTFEISGLEEGPFRVVAESRPPAETVERAPSEVEEKPATTKRKKPRPKRGARVQAVLEKVEAGASGIVLVLSAGSSLAGRVVDSAGKPFTKFEVSAQRIDHERAYLLGASDGHASTRVDDPDGRFVLEGLRDGEWDVVADAQGAARSLPRRIRVPHTEGPVEIGLVRAASIAGTVVDPGRQPVEDARFHVVATRFDPKRAWSAVKSDAQGRFVLDDVAPGPLRLCASAQGWADSEPIAFDLLPEQQVAGVTLVLQRGGTITGEVLDHAGRPDSARRVSVSRLDSSLRGQPAAECDERGRFETAALAPGKYVLRAELRAEELSARITQGESAGELTSHFKSVVVDVVEGATTHVVLGAPDRSPVRMHGTVRSGGEPVAGVRIGASPAVARGALDERGTHTDARGRYELVLDEPGEYEVSLARSKDGARYRRREAVPAGDSHALDFDLPVARITGRVVDENGASLAGVFVALGADRAAHARSNASSEGALRTGKDGAFAFTDLVPGTYRVQAGNLGTSALPGMSTSHATVVREGLAIVADTRLDGIVLAMTRGSVVEGIVLGALGAPAIGARVFVRDEHGVALLGWSSCTTDPAGRFRIEGLPAGRATFFARTQSLASEESAPVALEPGGSGVVELRLREATRLHVVVEEADGTIVGAQIRVFDERGRDCAGFSVSTPPGTSLSSAEIPGQYVATLPPGHYRVVATNHDGASASGSIELRGEPQATLTVERPD